LFGAGPVKTASFIDALIYGNKREKKNATKQLAPLQNLIHFKVLNTVLSPIGAGDIDDKVLDRVYGIDKMRLYDRDR